MNKKSQAAEIFFLFIEFIIAFLLIKGFGPVVYELTIDVPFGAIFRLILPSPESTTLDFLKTLIDTILVTGGTAIAIFKRA